MTGSDPTRQKQLGAQEAEATGPIRRLCELAPGQSGDCFVLLSHKQRGQTRDGKPYYRAVFRDAGRSATAMIWNDTPWFAECDQSWREGAFYKLRCRYFENQYGPQLDLERIREVREEDAADGFDPQEFYETSRFDIDEMFDQLLELAREAIADGPLRQLVLALLEDHGDAIRQMPAAVRNHHAFRGGYLEHVLSVTQTAVDLAEKYRAYYEPMQPPLSKSLVVAGAILHDIGKVAELDVQPQGARYTAQGRLVGHILLGRDLVREKAASIPEMDSELALRLEHIIVAHQNEPQWGSPIAPHTPEALLVHYADDLDAKFHMMAMALSEDSTEADAFTGRDNPLRRPIFRGLSPASEESSRP